MPNHYLSCMISFIMYYFKFKQAVLCSLLVYNKFNILNIYFQRLLNVT